MVKKSLDVLVERKRGVDGRVELHIGVPRSLRLHYRRLSAPVGGRLVIRVRGPSGAEPDDLKGEVQIDCLVLPRDSEFVCDVARADFVRVALIERETPEKAEA